MGMKFTDLFLHAKHIAVCFNVIFLAICSILVFWHEPKMALLRIIPENWTVENYTRLFLNGQFPRFVLNNMINAWGGAILITELVILAVYALALFDFKGKQAINAFILGMLLPVLTKIIPKFKLTSDLKLLNTYALTIMIFGAYSNPLSIWILKVFLARVPCLLEEAAAIDGTLRVQTFFPMVLPIITPGLVVTMLINFVYSWNNIFTPSILMRKPA